MIVTPIHWFPFWDCSIDLCYRFLPLSHINHSIDCVPLTKLWYCSEHKACLTKKWFLSSQRILVCQKIHACITFPRLWEHACTNAKMRQHTHTPMQCNDTHTSMHIHGTMLMYIAYSIAFVWEEGGMLMLIKRLMLKLN